MGQNDAAELALPNLDGRPSQPPLRFGLASYISLAGRKVKLTTYHILPPNDNPLCNSSSV